MDYLGKEYTLERDENFDGFLKAIGLPDDKIAALTSYKPTHKLVKNSDGTFSSFSSGPRGNRETKFTPGKELEETIGVDTIVKATYTIDGNTVTQIVKGEQGTATFKKEYKSDELVVTITSDIWDGVAHRYYKA